MHNKQHPKINNTISKLSVFIVLSVILLTGISLVPSIQLGVYGQLEQPQSQQSSSSLQVPQEQQNKVSLSQIIRQTAQQVATANPGTNATQVYQILVQLAKQIAQTSSQAEAIKEIRQISSQVTTYPFGTLSQVLSHFAQQVASGNSNIVQIVQQAIQDKASTGNNNIIQSLSNTAIQQTQQQEDQQDLMTELQRLQRVQRASELGEEGEEEEETETATGPTENVSHVFSYDTDVPSIRDLRKIQIETVPGSSLRDEVLGAIALGTPLGPAIGNSTSNGNLTSIANLTSIGNFTTATGKMTGTINARLPLNPPNTEPVSDTAGTWSGCGTGLLERVNPHWVFVRPTPNSPAWTQPVVAEGTITRSILAHTDFPFDHYSHDTNFHVKLDPKYTGLASRAHAPPDENGQYTMEQEWEIGYRNTGITDRFPKEFWPWEGDRVWMKGWWVIDCGHFKYLPVFGAYDYRTEIHPPFMTAFTRNEPYVFPGESSASSAVVTYIYLHGRGGNRDTNVGGQDYEFDIHMPQCTDPIDCHQLRYDVKSVPFGGPAPILTSKLQENKAHVVIPLSNTPASPDLRYGAIVAAKWVNPLGHNSDTQSSRTLRVTFDSIQIQKDHDPFASGEWNNLWVGVNGKWIELSGPLGHYGLSDADDRDTFAFPPGSKTVTLIVPENGELKIKSTGWESDGSDDYFGRGLPPTLPVGALDENDKIGSVDHVITCSRNFGYYLNPSFSPPKHTVVSRGDDDDDTDMDYFLTFHIEEISRTVGTRGGCEGPVPVTVPDVTCLSVGMAVTKVREAGLVPHVGGSGRIVIIQSPQEPEVLGSGSVVSLRAGNICP